jgi:hypothetical protein
MAYIYDEFGMPTGYEDEEERKRKEAQDPSFFSKVGSAIGQGVDNFKTNIANAPANFAANVAAIPDDFNRMLQVESGNRQVDSQGRIMTSPKGALGAAQVMPATAMNPGFGVPSIFDLAEKQGIKVQNRDETTAKQLLANENLNRQFGLNYHTAMKGKFGDQGGAAAYNAGPGAVQRNMNANAGRMNVGQLPQETQGYLAKLGNAVSSVIPSAQAGTVPQAPANVGSSGFQAYDRNRPGNAAYAGNAPAPQAEPTQATSPYSLATGVPQQGLGTAQQRAMPQPAVGMGPDTTTQAIGRFQLLQDNQDAMFKMAYDETQPEYLRQRAKDRGIELYNQQRELANAEKKLPTLTPTQVADTIKGGRGSVGDWAQYLLFKHLGLNDLANEKGDQLGIGHAYENATITDEKGNERSVEILRSASGKTLRGKFTGKDGAELTQDQLEQASAGILGKGVHISKVEDVINPMNGERIQEQTMSNGKTRYRKGGQAYTGDTSSFQNANAWEKDQDQKSAAANRFITANYAAGATPQQQYAAYRQAGVHPRYIESMMGLPEGTLTKQGGNQPAPAKAAEAEAKVPVATAKQEDIFAPVVQGVGESKTTFEARKADTEAKRKPLEKQIATPFIDKSAGIQQVLNNFRNAIEAIDSGEHNIGPLLGSKTTDVGAPVAQALGSLRTTKASENTKLIESYMTEAGLAKIKDTMGPAISNFDVQTKIKNMPVDIRRSPEAIRKWMLEQYKSVYDQAARAKDITERLNMIQPGSVDLGPTPAELAKPAEKKKERENNKVDRNNPLLK